MENKMAATLQSVELLPQEQKSGELADKVYYECVFCGKREGLYEQNRKLCEKLSGDEFYCTFCLRNGFNTKNNKNVMTLSFRGIIGYYYYALHCNPLNPDKILYLSEINDYVDAHIKVGLKNPVFQYDPDTYMWFIDFSRVGRDKKKVRYEEVLRTIANILLCFNINFHMTLKVSKLYEKFREAIEKFYTARYRPEGKRSCIPTVHGCMDYVTQHKSFTMEDTRIFTREHLAF